MTTESTPRPMIKMGNRMVPAQTNFLPQRTKPRKFLVVLQFYSGDLSAAEELAQLIADLERTRNHDADILLFRRSDCREIASTIEEKLKAKFETVHKLACRRTDARGHPWACNSMFYDLVALLGHGKPYRDDYYAFINLETDAVPTRPGWITELIQEWKGAVEHGKSVIGSYRTDPFPHINGLAVYPRDILVRSGNKLTGGDPRTAYDIRHANQILPLAQPTALIRCEWRKPTVTEAELFDAPEGIAPAIYHGVKDGSARAIVKARHIAVQQPQVRRPNVYTYVPATNWHSNDDRQSCLDLWRQGWISRGWNPVVLSFKDAQKHPMWAEFSDKVAKLPCAYSEREAHNHRFYRWLALDGVNGGFYADFEALPGDITPEVVGSAGDVFHIANGRTFSANVSQAVIRRFVDDIMEYDALPMDTLNEKPHVEDSFIVEQKSYPVGQGEGIEVFTDARVGNKARSVVMGEFLRGK